MTSDDKACSVLKIFAEDSAVFLGDENEQFLWPPHFCEKSFGRPISNSPLKFEGVFVG